MKIMSNSSKGSWPASSIRRSVINALIHLSNTSYSVSEAELKSLAEIYEQLSQDLLDGSPCRSCGDCCNFEKFGHELRVTHIELFYLIQKHGLRRPKKEGVCPYLEDGLCIARDGRALGCRVFFCDADKANQEQLYEKYLGRIRDLSSDGRINAYYGEFLSSLKDIQL